MAASGHARSKRAGNRHAHQRIDVQPTSQQRCNALLVDIEAGERDGSSGQRHAESLRQRRIGRKETHAFGCDRQNQGSGQLDSGTTNPCGSVSVTAFLNTSPRFRRHSSIAHRARVEPDSTQQIGGLVHNRRRRVDVQAAFAEAKGQRADAVKAIERAPDLRLLGDAIHRRNVQPSAFGRGGERGVPPPWRFTARIGADMIMVGLGHT